MAKKLIILYTPFICALIASVHGVLYLSDINVRTLYVLSEFTGHSILVILYMLVHSKRMCKWYKITLWLLMLVHFSNIMFYIGIIPRKSIIYVTLFINISALISWLIFRITYRTSKLIHSACKHSQE